MENGASARLSHRVRKKKAKKRKKYGGFKFLLCEGGGLGEAQDGGFPKVLPNCF